MYFQTNILHFIISFITTHAFYHNDIFHRKAELFNYIIDLLLQYYDILRLFLQYYKDTIIQYLQIKYMDIIFFREKLQTL